MAQMRQSKEERARHFDGHRVALIYHFETVADAEVVQERLEALGGLGDCIGHIWDEEDNMGYVAADYGSGEVLSEEVHYQEAKAWEDIEEGQFASTTSDVFALLPAEHMSSVRCVLGEVEK